MSAAFLRDISIKYILSRINNMRKLYGVFFIAFLVCFIAHENVFARTQFGVPCSADGSCYCTKSGTCYTRDLCREVEPDIYHATCVENPYDKCSYFTTYTNWQGCYLGNDGYCYGHCVCSASGNWNCGCWSYYADCDGILTSANGCERSVRSDINNCGDCNVICPSSPTPCAQPKCVDGSCTFANSPVNQYPECQSDQDCTANANGEVECACDGMGYCIDLCGDGICQASEDIATCSYDCNHPPTITSATPMPETVNMNNDIVFSVVWSDVEPGTGVSLHVCKTNQFSSACQQVWCTSTSSGSPITCSYTSKETDPSTNNFYAFVCDSYPYKSCSQPFQSQFYVNHPPTITTASSDADSLYGKPPGQDVTFTLIFHDQDSDTAKIQVCKTNNFLDCATSQWCSEPFYGIGSRTCSYTVPEEGYQTNPYYVFAVDTHGLVSQSLQKDFYEDREYRISKFDTRRVYTSKNTLEDVRITVMNKQIDMPATIELSIDGAGEFRVGTSRILPEIYNNGKSARFVGLPPMSEDVILLAIPNLLPLQGEPYKITLLRSSSDVEPNPETDQLEYVPYHGPSFTGLDYVWLFLLVLIAIWFYSNSGAQNQNSMN